MKKITKIDDFFQLDRYQLIVMLFNEMLIFTMLSNVIFNIFGVVPPKILGCDGNLYNGTTKAEICAQYDADINCVQPMLYYEFHSATVEFQQFCSRHERTWLDSAMGVFGVADKTKFSTTIQMIGIIVGSAFAGQCSDLYGRKRVLMVSLISMLIFSTSLSFLPNIDYFVIFRFFIGVFGGALSTVSVVFIIECIPTKHRFWMNTVITWAPNYILFALAAYLTRDWRLLSRVSNLTTVGAILVLAFFLEESPKFLVQKKRKEKAVEALVNINKWKRVEDQVSLSAIEALVNKEINGHENATPLLGKADKAKKYSFIHLYSSPSLTIKTFVTSFGLLGTSFVTYSLLFNLHVIQGSIFLNTALSGTLRYIIGAAVALADHFGGKSVGRKRVHMVTMGTICLLMATTFVVCVLGLRTELASVIQTTTLVAFGITGCMFLQMSLAIAEQFPTAVRNLASAHANVCGRIGNVIGPLLFSIDVGITGFPYLVITIVTFCQVVLFQVFLSETKGVPLPTAMPVGKSKSKEVLPLFDVTKIKEEN